MPILANVLLEQKNGRLFVTATDLEMQITAHSELEGKQDQSVTVAARKLQDILRALPDDATLNVDTSASKMTVRASRSRFNLQTLPAGDYPRISVAQEQQQTIKLPQRQFRGLLKLAEFAMAQQDIRYYLNGHAARRGQRVTADGGYRWTSAVVREPCDSWQLYEAGSNPATQDSARTWETARESDSEVTIDLLPNQVRFTFANIELVSKIVDGKFPDYNRVIPTGHSS